MLHELVFSLLGYPGDICTILQDASGTSSYHLKLISDRLPFVTPSEISLISQLLRLSQDYSRLQEYIRQFTLPGGKNLYRTALAYSIDNVLNDYRAVLYGVETDLLSDANQSLIFIYSKVDKFRDYLSTLVKLVDQISSNENHRHPLDTVVLLAETSFTSTKLALRRISQHLMRLLHHQISAWLLYGEIHDPGNEFLVDSGTLELSINNLPSFFSPGTINDILYTGKAVRQWNLSTIEEEFSARFAQLGHAVIDDDNLKPIVDVDGLERLIHDVWLFVSQEVSRRMFEECDLLNYLRRLKDIVLLGRGELFLNFFDNLRDQGDMQFSLRRQDKQPRNRDILDRPPASSLLEAQGLGYAVNRAFFAAARAIGLDDDELAARFKFTVSTNPHIDAAMQDVGATAWDCLQLEWAGPPPQGLETVFTESARAAYIRLFHLLLNVRRTEEALHRCWARDSTTSLYRSSSSSACANANLQQCMLLRHQMSFFVDHLNCYLQLDVIASQFDHLLERFESPQFLGSVEAQHEAFLAGLQAQALLLHPVIYPCLMRLLSVCRHFVHTSQFSQKTPIIIASGDHHNQVGLTLSPLTRLRDEFEHLSSVLFTSLSSAAQSHGFGVAWGDREGGKRHLAKLLLRLDFNRFFTTSLKAPSEAELKL